MNINLTCGDNAKYRRKVEVYMLNFDSRNKTFSMPWCIGDDWGQVLRCPMSTVPTTVDFEGNEAVVHFDRQQDADEFGAWLIEAEKEAQQGYRTMRG